MAKGIPIDTDPDPSPDAGARELRKYWTHGKGALKIKWGTPGDFNRCVSHLRKHVGAGAEGLCNVYHTSATGNPPGKGHKQLDTLFIPSDVAEVAIKGLIDALGGVETKANTQRALDSMSTGVSTSARNSAMNESRNRMATNDANARKKAGEKASKRRIRTQAGAKRYGGNIGDIIGKKKVEKGDTLSQLALDYYGDASKWKLIAEANKIKDPKKLMPGTDLVFPPDPDNPQGKGNAGAGSAKRSSRQSSKTPAGSKRQLTAGEQRALDARADHQTYDDKDSVALEATYYAPKNMAIEDVLKKFYGNTDRLDDVLKVNGLSKNSEILAGQSLILPGVDPADIYPSKKKRETAKSTADRKRQGKVPDESTGGAKAKATSHGYTLYNDGSVYGPKGWIVSATKKKAENRSKAKDRK